MSSILIAVDQKENRRHLEEYLRQRHSVTVIEELDHFDESIDLGIFDGHALHRLWRHVQRHKEMGKPLFFPVLLITPRQDITIITRQLWQTIDEVIFTPIEKVELLVRVEVLLRARRLSVDLEVKNDQLEQEIVIHQAVEGALRESEERLRVALLNAPLILANNNHDLQYTWVYNAHQGFNVEGIVGKRDDELAPRERVAALMALKQKVLESGVGVREEVRIGWQDDYRLYDVTAEPIYDLNGSISGVTTAALDITEYRRAEEKAAEAAAIEERHRLARDLHDAVSQVLFSASVITESLPRMYQNKPDRVMEQLGVLHTLIRGAAAEMRTLLWELRPENIINTKLPDLLTQLSHAAQARMPLEIKITTRDNIRRELPTDVHVAFYRIAQESLNNIIKHGQASHVKIGLRQADGYTALILRDNGRGFDITKVGAGFGLKNMQERAESVGGRCDIQSKVGVGTRVRLLWPCKLD